MLRRLTACLLLCGLPLMGYAQDLEYRMELGGGMGMTSYLGDISSSPLKHPGMLVGIIGRRLLNPRMAVKGNLTFGHLSGRSKGVLIPQEAGSHTAVGGTPVELSFKRNVLDLGAQFEFNFWGYGTGAGYKELSPLTPYATAGLGFTLALGGGNPHVALNAPVGVGVKYKVRPRINLGVEVTVRFTTSDRLDATRTSPQLDAPYAIPSVGLKNKDCYTQLLLFVTYDLSPKYRKCNN